MFPRLALLVAVALLTACTNFHCVDEGRVYRSAQPEAEDLREWFGAYGIKTIVQLRRIEPSPEARALMDRDRVTTVPIPLSARVYPSRTQLVAIWDTFATAQYPILIHCRAGADRTGLAAAIYVLQKTGDLALAREELALRYLHTGWGTNRLDRVFEMYSRWHGRMDFRRWADTVYHPPESFSAQDPADTP